ncbi:hypothetical protein PCASD_01085 [Puccinia coronata f. sp. avenae]|uniref:Uncharacterized protein n=1 Tax=Puccinia coronata f. sp. avenae TaxID=200324 RepID=A0A2N5SY84_9BASI|nr:hypothetical protein PCASD_16940 [Puccinia coronata f. sp. avenae]PLW50941.1 hypothetical protein PCASD_01085 [Puccinia coronata f. sp. avenae]
MNDVTPPMPAIGRHHWLSGRHLPAHPLFELLTVDHYRCDPGTPRVPADDQWAHFWMAIGRPELGGLGTVPRSTTNRTDLLNVQG